MPICDYPSNFYLSQNALLLWPVRTGNVLKARAVASGMIIGRVDAPGWVVFARDIGLNISAIAVRCHYAMNTPLYATHHQVGIEDRHMFVVGIRFAAAQEIGQVNRQKAHSWHAR